MKTLSIIAPFYNEENVVSEYISRVTSTLAPLIIEGWRFEILAIDDGSSDRTYEVLKKMQHLNPDFIRIIKFTRNFGLEAAISAGLKYSRGDLVITMDTDLQDPPEVILQLIERWKAGFEIVLARRATRADSLYKKITAKIFYKILGIFSGKIKYVGDVANFRLHTRKVVDLLNSMSEINQVYRVASQFTGFKFAVIDYHRDERFAGETKYDFNKMLAFSFETLVSSSIQPLGLVKYIFLVVLLITLSLPIINLFDIWWLNDNFVLTELLFILFSLLFFTILLISEYLGQIVQEVKKKPRYIVEDENIDL